MRKKCQTFTITEPEVFLPALEALDPKVVWLGPEPGARGAPRACLSSWQNLES